MLRKQRIKRGIEEFLFDEETVMLQLNVGLKRCFYLWLGVLKILSRTRKCARFISHDEEMLVYLWFLMDRCILDSTTLPAPILLAVEERSYRELCDEILVGLLETSREVGEAVLERQKLLPWMLRSLYVRLRVYP